MSEYVSPSNAISRAGAGVVGGLTGGIVLGILLQVMGLMPGFAKLVGRSSTQAAWTTHLTIAAVAGGLFAILVGHMISRQVLSAGGVGLVYGIALGLIFVLLVLPIAAGTSVFNFDDDALRAIGSYGLFGVIVGVIYAVFGPKRRYYDYAPRRQVFGFMSAAVPRRRRRRRDDDD
jgi:hypothetical protein